MGEMLIADLGIQLQEFAWRWSAVTPELGS